jgi:hypothetical protein
VHQRGAINGRAAACVLGDVNLVRALALADGATQGGVWSLIVPYDWKSGNLSVIPYWLPGSTDASSHAVRWQTAIRLLNSGQNYTSGGTQNTAPATGAAAARTANVLVIDSTLDTGATPAGTQRLVMLSVHRLGGDAADTYVGTVNLVGVRVIYTAKK